MDVLLLRENNNTRWPQHEDVTPRVKMSIATTIKRRAFGGDDNSLTDVRT